jgi:aryl-alcohol dehydrogenase-like predicted oxidoreductase
MPYCTENNITILAYSPMAQGLLTGKFGPDHTFAKGDHRAANRLFQPDNFQRAQKSIARLHPIAKRNNVTLAQLALAWAISRPGTCAIAGARKAEQVIQNAKAAEVSLPEGDLAEMDAVGRMVTDYLDQNPVMWNF